LALPRGDNTKQRYRGTTPPIIAIHRGVTENAPADDNGDAPMGSQTPLFTFAIITDTHIRPAVLDDSSPFPVNDLANDRARYAIAAIARHEPEFILHLGDMVHTLPHLPTYGDACLEAHKIFAPLLPRMKFMPGNHDIGDKPMPDAPAAPADEEAIARFEQAFGPSYHSFEHGDCLFAMINSSLINSGNAHETAQREWLEGVLANAGSKRVFLCSHYPPYIYAPREQSHYDNYAEPGRSWLVGLIEKYAPEAVLSGHVHQFFYNRINDTRLYCLPPTSFIRQDYAEIYRLEPADQYGRNDTGKFSYAIVDVLADGHRIRVVPTDGKQLAEGAELPADDDRWARNPATPLTVHLRHAWAEPTDLPYNGPMEEFSRKRARNDYTLLRLQQMGLNRVRVPLADLVDPAVRPRIVDYQTAGITFQYFCLGVPRGDELELLASNRGLVRQLELVSGSNDLADLGGKLGALSALAGPPIIIGKSHSSKHEARQGSKFSHSVSYGFKWEDREQVLTALRGLEGHHHVSGLTFQLNLTDDLAAGLKDADAFAAANDIQVSVNVRLADTNPAIANFDDDAIAERVLAAAELAGGLENVEVQLDTFVDVDRGYNPRHGLLDRRYNFRKAGRALAQRHQ
jgi:3',5'-cyclic AMP phosphodiesterase CpdA